jgi:hypothetical protein
MDIKSKVTQEKSLEIEIKKVIYWYKKLDKGSQH